MFFEKEEYDTGGLIQVELPQEDICPVDLYVKSKVVLDALALARKSQQSLSTINELNSMSRILPNISDHAAHSVNENV